MKLSNFIGKISKKYSWKI